MHPPVLALWRRAGVFDVVDEAGVFDTIRDAVQEAARTLKRLSRRKVMAPTAAS